MPVHHLFAEHPQDDRVLGRAGGRELPDVAPRKMAGTRLTTRSLVADRTGVAHTEGFAEGVVEGDAATLPTLFPAKVDDVPLDLDKRACIDHVLGHGSVCTLRSGC